MTKGLILLILRQAAPGVHDEQHGLPFQVYKPIQSLISFLSNFKLEC